MNVTPFERSSRTAVRMSRTVSATCCTPSPRRSSLKMLICELLKNGRAGSLFANLVPLAGSHITIDLRPEPVLRAGSTSDVWNATSHICSKPSTCSSHSSIGFMVWKFVVTWSMSSNPNLFLPPP